VQSGFSYDRLVNGTLNLFTDHLDRLVKPNFSRGGRVQQTATTLVGTFPSNSYAATTNTSANAARAVWHALQVFAADFPEHRSRDRRLSVWTESYGGHYGPALAGFIHAQNARVAAGSTGPRGKWRKIELDALGIIAGTVDTSIEAEPALRYRFNNTYGLRMLSQSGYSSARSRVPACQAAIARCRQTAARLDPDNRGGNAQSNAACFDAFRACSGAGAGDAGRSAYDIASPTLG
jgi:carboxypeptidase D